MTGNKHTRQMTSNKDNDKKKTVNEGQAARDTIPNVAEAETTENNGRGCPLPSLVQRLQDEVELNK